MSTLQVANVHLESTANNRIQYVGLNTVGLYAGGVQAISFNSTTVTVPSAITVLGDVTTQDIIASGNVTAVSLIASGVISSNGSTGTAGQILTSAAAGNAYWSSSQSIGIGQTWQDVTASRAVSTSYQNLTGRPISVQIRITASSSPFQVSTDNVTFVSIAAGTSTAGVGGWIGGIIPPNHYYRINGAATINGWTELR